jgi:hypothetical protein
MTDVPFGQLLEPVRGVLALAGLARAVALDGLGQDHRGPSVALGGLEVGGVDLARIVAAPGQLLELRVRQVADQVEQLGVLAEELPADVGAALDHVLLVLAVDHLVHASGQEAGLVAGEQFIPVAAPDHLDDIPAGPAELALEVLDDLAVAAHRAVEALEVAVDDPDEVVQVLAAGHPDGAMGFRFVGLAVADEGPDHRVVVLRHQLAGLQVAAEAGLVDGVDRSETHRDGREDPEVRHQERMRVGAEARVVLQFLAEVLQVLVVEPVLEVGPGVVARGRMPLEIDHVGRLAVGAAAEEVVEPDLVEGGQRGEGGDVPADIGRLVGLGHHGHGVPAHMGADEPLHLEIARVFGLLLRRDGVEVGGRGDVREVEPAGAKALDDASHQTAGLLRRLAVEHQSKQLLHRGAMPVGGLGQDGQGATRRGAPGAPIEGGGRTVVGTGGIQDSSPGWSPGGAKGIRLAPTAKCGVGRFKRSNPEKKPKRPPADRPQAVRVQAGTGMMSVPRWGRRASGTRMLPSAC